MADDGAGRLVPFAQSMPAKALFSITVAVALAMLAACVHPPPTTPRSATRRVEFASADDCAILVAIGKSELQWGEKPPSAALLSDFSLPDGGIYREDCSWSSLGVAAPVLGDSRSPMAFFVTRPIYSGTHATAFFQYGVASVRRPGGAVLPPFLEREQCSLEKRAGTWHLLRCKLSRIVP